MCRVFLNNRICLDVQIAAAYSEINTAAVTLGFIAADGHIPEVQITGFHDDTATIAGVVAAGDPPAADTVIKDQIAVCCDHVAVCHSRRTGKPTVDVVTVQVDGHCRAGRQRSVGSACCRVARQRDGGHPRVQLMLYPLPDRQELRVKRHVPAHGAAGKIPFVLEIRFRVPALYEEPVFRRKGRFRDF